MSPYPAMALLAVVLAAAAVTDLRTGTVPNWLTYPAIGAGLVCWAVVGAVHSGPAGAAQALAGAGAGLIAAFVPFTMLFAAGGLGGGDVKLMTALGAIGGSWQIVLAASLYSFLIAAAIAVVIMVRHGLVRRTFARLFGAALTWAARARQDRHDDSPRVPFALAVCLGGLLAGAELLLGLHTPWAQAAQL